MESLTQSCVSGSSAELDGSSSMEAATIPTSVQLDSTALHELPSLAGMPVELDSDIRDHLDSTSVADMNNNDPSLEWQYGAVPMVSPMSSMDQSRPTTLPESWYTSQSSAVSAFPTETSHSFTNVDHSMMPVNTGKPQLPSITTAWLYPPTGDLLVSQITESPTDISAADQLRFETVLSSTTDYALGSMHRPAELTAPSKSSSTSFDDILMDIDTWPGPDGLSAGHAEEPHFILGSAAPTTATELQPVAPVEDPVTDSSAAHVMVSSVVDDGQAVGRLLAACEDYASILREDCPNAIVEYLRDTFFLTWSYCREQLAPSNAMYGAAIGDLWPGEPSIEAGLEGLHDLMTDGRSTLHRLVSLLFLSFSLICVSLAETEDLELAVLCLHQSARSWAAYIRDPVEASLLPDFVDNLWELTEDEGQQLQAPSIGQSNSSLLDLVNAYMSSGPDFVLEIARRFVDGECSCAISVASILISDTAIVAAALSAPWGDMREVRCVVDAPPSYVDVLCEPVLMPLAREARLGCSSSQTAYSTLTQRLVTDHTAHRPTKPDDVLGILRDHDLQRYTTDDTSLSIRYTLPTIQAGLSHLAKASRWILATLQRSAHRVVSDPTGLTPPRRSATAPDVMEGPCRGGAQDRGLSPSFRPLSRSFSSGAEQIQRSRTKATAKPRIEPWHCDEHNISFPGKYGRSAYYKHMTSTVAHKVKRLSCPRCTRAFPRPDHLKLHCKNDHQMLMTGRAGKYQFWDMGNYGNEFVRERGALT